MSHIRRIEMGVEMFEILNLYLTEKNLSIFLIVDKNG